ncbi:MAG: DnaA regulatory inactivator Hda [Aquisalimonadaceae bacterium]
MAQGEQSVTAQLPLAIRWNDIAGFEQFVPGANIQAVEAVAAAADGVGGGYVYLHGASGTGRTHLLQAACRRCGERGAQAVYLPLEQTDGLDPGLLEGLESLALIAMDDLHLVAGKPNWEEAVFHLYNRVLEAGGRLLISASARPAKLGISLPDLESRLSWGLVHRLQPLSEPELLQALERRALARGLELPADTGRYLISRVPRDAGSLFSLLDRLDQAALAAQRRLTVPFVRRVLFRD